MSVYFCVDAFVCGCIYEVFVRSYERRRVTSGALVSMQSVGRKGDERALVSGDTRVDRFCGGHFILKFSVISPGVESSGVFEIAPLRFARETFSSRELPADLRIIQTRKARPCPIFVLC